jgi:hypothetical protein
MPSKKTKKKKQKKKERNGRRREGVQGRSNYLGDRRAKHVCSSLDLTYMFIHSGFFHCTVFSYLWITHDCVDWSDVCYLFCPFHPYLVDCAKTFRTLGNRMLIKVQQN